MPGDAARDGTRGELIADRYELRTRLGRGGMGEVWAGRDLRLHRDVAVKLFRGDAAAPDGLPDWLRREGIAAAQINHPNVAVLYDQGAHQGRIYLVMELVSGATLDGVMRSGRLPVRDAVRFAVQICDALAAAHAAQVVHRDIKPQNVLITPDGTVKVVDFGIAGFLNDTRSWTIARFEDAVKGSGTPEYAAPEQVIGHHADARSDLYSLGTLLYAMLAGRVPFAAESFLAVMHRKVTEDAPPLNEGCSGLPVLLVGLVESLLAREPEARPRSARAVAEQLRAIGTQLDAPAARRTEAEAAEPVAVPATGQGQEQEPSVNLQPRPKVEGSGHGAEDRTPWTPEPASPPKPVEPVPTQKTAPPAAVPPFPKAAAIPEAKPTPQASSIPRPAPSPRKADPEAKPVKKVEGHGQGSIDPLAATDATRLSSVAPVELRGKSLLPPAARSLLREPVHAPYTPPFGIQTGNGRTDGADRADWVDHGARRQIIVWTLLGLLLVATVVAVYAAVTVK